MSPHRRLHVLAVPLAIAAIALVAVGCADPKVIPEKQPADSGGSTMPMTDTAGGGGGATSTAAAGTVTVDLAKSSPFSIEPSATSIPAGKTTFDVTNDGTMTHELVVLQTDKTIKQLTKPDGTADEADNIGETGDVEAGASTSFTVDLKPGHYWLICNLPGHFAGGMYTELTVT